MKACRGWRFGVGNGVAGASEAGLRVGREGFRPGYRSGFDAVLSSFLC